MKNFRDLTLPLLVSVCTYVSSQDLLILNGSSLQQGSQTTNAGVRASSQTSTMGSAIGVGSTLQNQSKGQIGVTTQTNNGNINSPSKASDELQISDNEPIIEEKNQLQIFLAETTGKQLDLYGHTLFKKSRYSPITQMPAPVNYVIGPGDEIDVKVWGSVDFNTRQIVDRDGRITLPQIGSFGVAGVKVDKLDETLKRQIGRIYKGFEVSGTLSRIRSIQVYVVGNARKPGAYSVSGMSTLISALFDATGPSQNGSMRKIRLIRDGKEISQVDLYEFIKNGESAGNVKLMSGDVIQIPAVGKRVALLGAIDGQAIYELKDKDDSLGGLIGFVGEENTLISEKKIVIERITKGDTSSNRSVDEVVFNDEGMKFGLKDGDIITLLKINSQYSNAVTLRGNVAYPLRYKFSAGMKVSDLIPDTEALIRQDYYTKRNLNVMSATDSESSILNNATLENQKDVKTENVEKNRKEYKNSLNLINWEYAAIERIDKNNVKLNIIPFNLGKAVREKDPKHDLNLMAGDVVVVYSDKDIQIPQSKRNIFVKISGEINAPGLYQVTQGERLIDLVNRSGGLTGDAYVYGTNFTRESIKKLQQENLTKAINRLESDINSQATASIQNNINQEMVVIAQQQLASQKAFLNKLRGIQATGRISLEMNPEEPKYPDVVLEDGDDITIPSKPSFVGIFGSVYTESTFIFKQNATVKDYLSKAGLARESDVNAVMVIRADASIDSDNKSSSYFSKSVMDMKLYPGDTIFVPEAFDRRTAYTQFMQGAKDWTTILYQFGIGAAAWKTLKN
jgi:protein involved in polysaccharide export with SLBB domain